MANTFPTPTGRLRPPARWGDRIFHALVGAGGFALVLLAVALIAVLWSGSEPTSSRYGVSFLWRTQPWNAETDAYGAAPQIIGTLVTSAIALLLAVPLSVGAAIFLTQQAPRWLRGPVAQVIELLAAVPSIVFGFWALVVLVPIMRYQIEPTLKVGLGWTGLFSSTPIGLDYLTASVVLAVMVVPTITAISRDSIAAVPRDQREGALSLGATTWEASSRVIVPYARSGIFGGVVLGLGRALGETMAVTLTIGNNNYLPVSLLSQGQTLASLIANEFTEASGKSELSALIEAGLVLLVITFLVNVVARFILHRFEVSGGNRE
ncbi:MAG TPA: phosphate ABC transporter permease subunit PstC [Thermoplasmata archaeon]|nr:phosphate ABC transporter permease subunit PstC [Thermoplasmata archaeon]